MKSYKWRIYADNNIESEIVAYLRKERMDVLWVAEDPKLRRETDDPFHYRKAKELGRYLLTHDADFWDDRSFPLHSCPGVIILSTADAEVGKWIVVLLRKLLKDYNVMDEPLYIDGVKMKVSGESITIKMVDHDTQKVTTETWAWSDLY